MGTVTVVFSNLPGTTGVFDVASDMYLAIANLMDCSPDDIGIFFEDVSRQKVVLLDAFGSTIKATGVQVSVELFEDVSLTVRQRLAELITREWLEPYSLEVDATIIIQVHPPGITVYQGGVLVQGRLC